MTTRKLKTRVGVGNFVNVINASNIYTTHCWTTCITGNKYWIMLVSALHWANCRKINVTECILSKATDLKRDNVPYGASAIRHAQSQLWSQAIASKAYRPWLYSSYEQVSEMTSIILLQIIIIIIIIEFFTSLLWLGNIHLSWDVLINRIRLGGLICRLKSLLQLNMCKELQIFAVVYMYWGAS